MRGYPVFRVPIAAEGGWSRGERQRWWNFNDAGYGRWEWGKERRWGVALFRGEEGDEARQLHSAGGGWHSEERRDGQGGRRRWLMSGGRR
jgi:hypothetical protein